jgi:hypothetical protein
MHRITLTAALATAMALTPPAAGGARSEVLVHIDKSAQRMSVVVDGSEKYVWAVSTGLAGGPPTGTYRPERFERDWYSRTFNWAPMPHSIFFHGPYAIHGTPHISRLGNRASKGCVRLHPDNAKELFSLVQSRKTDTRIVVGSTGLSGRALSAPAAERAAKSEPRAKPAVPAPAAAKPKAPAQERAQASEETTGSIPAPELAGSAMERAASVPEAESGAVAARRRFVPGAWWARPPAEDNE